jgi:multidrug resistance efflux pump
MFRKYVLPAVAAALLLFSIFQVVRGQQKPPKLEPPVQPSRMPFNTGVAGAGLVEAQTENISVGSALAGIVTEVNVKVGDRVSGPSQAPFLAVGPGLRAAPPSEEVRKGTVLFRLDDRNLRAELRVREANLAAAVAQLDKLNQMPRPEEVPSSEARVEEAKANLLNLEDQNRRAQAAFARQGIAEEELITREQQARVAREQYRRADADYKLLKAGAWSADKDIARANIEQMRNQVEQTRIELERLEVRALVDGEVLQVNVRPGEFVGAPPSQALIVLGSVKQLHVRVDIDEHDIPRFRPGAPARAMLRGDPRQEFRLRFVRVEPYVIPKKSLTGDNTERVDTRVLQVIYAIEDPAVRVYVGQQLDVYVEGADRAP